MDHAALDVYAFFSPNRLVWNHWKEFMGENNTTHWEQPTEYTIPQITAPSGGWTTGSLADYLGMPIGIGNISESALPFRHYCRIYNDWFVDENIQDPVNITIDDSTTTGINKGVGYDYVTDTQKGAYPLYASKWRDYFTSCLPSPQCGPSVTLPLGKTAPVIGTDSLKSGYNTPSSDYIGEPIGIGLNTSNVLTVFENKASGAGGLGSREGFGLAADLSDATAATITELRQAFAIQRYYEAIARGGHRYIEQIYNIFGVSSPDARQQRAEYLGGKRFQINMDQVLQTSSTDATSPQGNTSAFSCTVNSDNLCTYSATEHGFFFILVVIRTNHSYQQGIERFWSRKKRFDYYFPQFANLSEMPVLNKELYAQGSNVVDTDGNIIDEQVFGYQEAWADYRYHPNRISGKLRSTATGTLDLWHYGDKYTSLPHLSPEWIVETEANVQRTLAVQNEPQFLCDFYIDATWTRIMPLHSVPGLMDHH